MGVATRSPRAVRALLEAVRRFLGHNDTFWARVDFLGQKLYVVAKVVLGGVEPRAQQSTEGLATARQTRRTFTSQKLDGPHKVLDLQPLSHTYLPHHRRKFPLSAAINSLSLNSVCFLVVDLARIETQLPRVAVLPAEATRTSEEAEERKAEGEKRRLFGIVWLGRWKRQSRW
ncbi:hypothetical protein BLNAU_24755 [Blattamonas nauphoetae]|uniref:Uncharacterized protein n=1 Tax=Blattamonas nauphoetae TaxID=2049346 RepID=A0ABQ9WMD3_9EUKA|nr:hypothetical protein BLNAU_24755 [Blattamonas nauphoetae]